MLGEFSSLLQTHFTRVCIEAGFCQPMFFFAFFVSHIPVSMAVLSLHVSICPSDSQVS